LTPGTWFRLPLGRPLTAAPQPQLPKGAQEGSPGQPFAGCPTLATSLFLSLAWEIAGGSRGLQAPESPSLHVVIPSEGRPPPRTTAAEGSAVVLGPQPRQTRMPGCPTLATSLFLSLGWEIAGGSRGLQAPEILKLHVVIPSQGRPPPRTTAAEGSAVVLGPQPRQTRMPGYPTLATSSFLSLAWEIAGGSRGLQAPEILKLHVVIPRESRPPPRTTAAEGSAVVLGPQPRQTRMPGCPTLATSLFLSLGWEARALPKRGNENRPRWNPANASPSTARAPQSEAIDRTKKSPKPCRLIRRIC